MARRATSLGPKPSLFYLFLFFWFFLCFVFFVFFSFCFLFFLGGGFKGQVRWPEGPPHLALNPPYFICFCFCCCFFVFFFAFFFFFLVSLSLLLLEKKKPVFPPKKGHFLCIFSVSPFVSL